MSDSNVEQMEVESEVTNQRIKPNLTVPAEDYLEVLKNFQQNLIKTIKCIKFVSIENILIIDSEIDCQEWLNSMEVIINQRNRFEYDYVDSSGVNNGAQLCEANFYYGLVNFANGFTDTAKYHLDLCKNQNNNRIDWFLKAMTPIIECNNDWLPLFLKCDLVTLLEEIYKMWNEYCTPKPEEVFNCFNVSFKDVKAFVFGESPLTYHQSKLYESTGFCWGVRPKNIESAQFSDIPKAILNIFTVLTLNWFHNEYKVFEDGFQRYFKQKCLDVVKFGLNNKYIFLNIRLSTHTSESFKPAKDVWDAFTSKIIDYFITKNKDIKIFCLFYSPLNSVQYKHLVRDVLNKHIKNGFKAINYDIGFHITYFDDNQIETLSSKMCLHPEFYQLLRYVALMSCDNLVRDKDFDNENISLVNKFLKTHENLICDQQILEYYRLTIEDILSNANLYINKLKLFINVIKVCVKDSFKQCSLNLMLHCNPITNEKKYTYLTKEHEIDNDKRVKYMERVFENFIRDIHSNQLLFSEGEDVLTLMNDFSYYLERNEYDMINNSDIYYDFIFPTKLDSIKLFAWSEGLREFCYSIYAIDDQNIDSGWRLLDKISTNSYVLKVLTPIRILKFVNESESQISKYQLTFHTLKRTEIF